MNKIYKAILNKDQDIFKNYIVLSKLLKINKMEDYLYVASRRIIDYVISDKSIANHIVIDYLNNDIWLDINGYIKLKPIILGYLEDHQYLYILENMNQLRMKNSISIEILRCFQRKNLKNLFLAIINGIKGKYKSYNLNITLLAILELLSRTIFVRKYFSFKKNMIIKKVRKTANQCIYITKINKNHIA